MKASNVGNDLELEYDDIQKHLETLEESPGFYEKFYAPLNTLSGLFGFAPETRTPIEILNDRIKKLEGVK